jgi:hypothetical protein
MVAHESSAGTAKSLWSGQPKDVAKPMVIEQFEPFVNGYSFFDEMGVRIYENGHSYTGVKHSIHSAYSAIPDYESAMVGKYGEERARESRSWRRITVKATNQEIAFRRRLELFRQIDRIHRRPDGDPFSRLAGRAR